MPTTPSRQPATLVPAYAQTFARDKLGPQVERALKLLQACTVCPRSCKVNRLAEINRRLTQAEFERALKAAWQAGLKRAVASGAC
jgi:hypothetical protein